MPERVRIGQLAGEVGLHGNKIRRLADAGAIPSQRTEGGQRVFGLQAVKDTLAARSTKRHPAPAARIVAKKDGLSWEMTVSLPGLQEHEV